MGKLLKWIGMLLGALVGLIVLALVVVFVVSGSRFNRTYDVQPADITLPTDEASIAEGEHLATSGGLLETKKIGDLAQEYGIAMAMHMAAVHFM